MFDYLVVGAGFAGAVMAERLAADGGRKVLHRRQTHARRRQRARRLRRSRHSRSTPTVPIFFTRIRVRCSSTSAASPSGGRTSTACGPGSTVNWCRFRSISTPSIVSMVSTLTSFELEQFFESVAEPRTPVRTSEDVIVSKVGRELYNKFFRNYTRKQWGLDPVRAGCDGHGPGAGPYQPRRSLFLGHLSGDAAPWIHPHVRADARASQHQGDVEHGLPRDRERHPVSRDDLHGPDRRVLRLSVRQAAVSFTRIPLREASTVRCFRSAGR